MNRVVEWVKMDFVVRLQKHCTACGTEGTICSFFPRDPKRASCNKSLIISFPYVYKDLEVVVAAFPLVAYQGERRVFESRRLILLQYGSYAVIKRDISFTGTVG